MLCLEVLRNGKRIARAGVRRGSVSAHVNRTSRDDGPNVESLPDNGAVPGLTAWITGSNAIRARRRERVTWARLRRLRLGDELVIRVVRSDRTSSPVSREPVPNRRITESGALYQCSLCRKWRGDREVDAPSMVFGREVAMCAQCVFLAAALVEAKAERALHLRSLQGEACSFCHKHKSRLVGTKRVAVCTTCLKRFRPRF